jgi:hypothetical protein
MGEIYKAINFDEPLLEKLKHPFLIKFSVTQPFERLCVSSTLYAPHALVV